MSATTPHRACHNATMLQCYNAPHVLQCYNAPACPAPEFWGVAVRVGGHGAQRAWRARRSGAAVRGLAWGRCRRRAPRSPGGQKSKSLGARCGQKHCTRRYAWHIFLVRSIRGWSILPDRALMQGLAGCSAKLGHEYRNISATLSNSCSSHLDGSGEPSGATCNLAATLFGHRSLPATSIRGGASESGAPMSSDPHSICGLTP